MSPQFEQIGRIKNMKGHPLQGALVQVVSNDRRWEGLTAEGKGRDGRGKLDFPEEGHKSRAEFCRRMAKLTP